MTEFTQIVLLFFLYSFVGWLWETVYCSIKARHFVYRGFLVGPITPIYGFGILGVLYLLRPLHNQLLLLFCSSCFSDLIRVRDELLLEKLFHASWWDYHNVFEYQWSRGCPNFNLLGHLLCLDRPHCSSANVDHCPNVG